MAYSRRRLPNPQSSVVKCEERYACDARGPGAVIECEECGSKQCRVCDSAIHSSDRKRNHDRKALKEANKNELCQSETCLAKNYAQLICLDCSENKFCYPCFESTHPKKSMRANHNYTTLKQVQNVVKDFTGPTVAEREVNDFALNLVEEDFKTCHYGDVYLEDGSKHDMNMHSSDQFATPRNSNSMPDVAADAISSCEAEKLRDICRTCFHLLDSSEKILVCWRAWVSAEIFPDGEGGNHQRLKNSPLFSARRRRIENFCSFCEV